MSRPKYMYIQSQNVALLLQKCVKISSEYLLLLYPKVSQVKPCHSKESSYFHDSSAPALT